MPTAHARTERSPLRSPGAAAARIVLRAGATMLCLMWSVGEVGARVPEGTGGRAVQERAAAVHELALPVLEPAGPVQTLDAAVPTEGAPSRRALLVLAASSLTDVLPAIVSGWSDRTGTEVRFSFDATSRLAPQALAGAPADVFVSADEFWIRWLEEQGAVERGTARPVAANELVVVVPRGGPTGSLLPADLVHLERVAVGGENVPVGRYARQALSVTGIWERLGERVVTAGSARGVLEWVARGEVAAGVVFRTDALAEPRVEIAFAFPPATHEPARYWAAPLEGAGADAGELLDFLSGPEAERAFAQAGFTPAADGPPPDGRPPDQVAPSASAPPLPSVGSAIRLSLLVALLATLAGLVPAVALGWLLARRDFRGKTLVSTAVLAPLVLPPVVTGFLLLSVFGTQGTIGGPLAALGLRVPFTVLGAALAAFVVGMPLYVLSIRGAFEAIDRQYEELSWTLGVPPRSTFARVSLPLALPGIAAGAILAFARALGEFGATVVLAGNVEGSTRTIALAVYTLLEAPSGRATTWTLVGASVALSLLALIGYETLSRRQRRRLEDDHGR